MQSAKMVSLSKKEGDGCTPIGTFSLRRLFIRKDRIKKITTSLSQITIVPNMAWEDNPKSKNYNKLIFLKKIIPEKNYLEKINYMI